MEHASIAPSSAYQLVPCPGSLQAQAGFLEEESQDTKEGTASHWVAGNVLIAFKQGGSGLLCSSYIGQTAPNGVIITEEMADGAQMFVTHVLSIAQEHGLLRSMYVEERVDIPQIHPTDCWGTPDVWMNDKANNTIYLPDYKYGHRYIDEFENWQLIFYDLGVLSVIGRDQDIKIINTIVQPRYYKEKPIRSWTIQAHDLQPFADKARKSAALALGSNPPITPGPHCRDCLARCDCVGAQKAAMASIDISQQLELTKYPAAALGTEIVMLERAADAINFRLTGKQAEAEQRIKSGEQIPGLGLKETQSNLKWDKPVAYVFVLGDLFKLNLRKEPVPCTPTQAIKKGVDESVIKQYASRTKTGLKLVTDTNKLARKIFGNTTGD